MCALLVGLPDVVVVGVGDWPLCLRIEIAAAVVLRQAGHRHGIREVMLVDLPVYGRPARQV